MVLELRKGQADDLRLFNALLVVEQRAADLPALAEHSTAVP